MKEKNNNPKDELLILEELKIKVDAYKEIFSEKNNYINYAWAIEFILSDDPEIKLITKKHFFKKLINNK